jgi:hypothetical protein
VDYLDKMVALTMSVRTLREADGDQGIHNYLLRKPALEGVTIHDNRFLPVMTLGLVPRSDLRFDERGRILDQSGIVVPVLHQYDRDDEVRESLFAQLSVPEREALKSSER